MTGLAEALDRLERAVVRLEKAAAASAATRSAATHRLAEGEAERRRLRAAAGEIAGRVDDALAKLDHVLEGEA